MIQATPFPEDLARFNIHLLNAARQDHPFLPGESDLGEFEQFTPVGAGKRRRPAGEDIVLVDIEFPHVIDYRSEILLLVLLVEDDTMSSNPPILEVVLHEKREMRFCVDVVDRFEVEDVAIVP